MSFLARHRTICAVLDDIRAYAKRHSDPAVVALCAEAKDYAQRMSNRLMEYKRKEDEDARRIGNDTNPSGS